MPDRPRLALDDTPRWEQGTIIEIEPERQQLSPQARTDVLDKLLALNHYRHQQELVSGVLNKKKPRTNPSKPRPATQDAPALDDGTLFLRQTPVLSSVPCQSGSRKR